MRTLHLFQQTVSYCYATPWPHWHSPTRAMFHNFYLLFFLSSILPHFVVYLFCMLKSSSVKVKSLQRELLCSFSHSLIHCKQVNSIWKMWESSTPSYLIKVFCNFQVPYLQPMVWVKPEKCFCSFLVAQPCITYAFIFLNHFRRSVNAVFDSCPSFPSILVIVINLYLFLETKEPLTMKKEVFYHEVLF